MSRVWKHLNLLAIAWLLTGCALGGTEAGNPGMSTLPNAEPASAPVQGQYAQFLIDTVCAKYHDCYPNISRDYCELGVLQQTNLPKAFGYSDSNNPTTIVNTQDMVNEERAGRARANPANASTCAQEIRQLTCASPTINAAAPTGANSSASSYTGVINMIPTSGTSCAGVF